MNPELKAIVERKFNKKQTDCLLKVFNQVGIRSWVDLQNLPGLIGLPAVCGQSVYELVEKLNQARTETVEVEPVTADQVTEPPAPEEQKEEAEQAQEPDPKPKRRSRSKKKSDAKETDE
jgi:hypothetical protein